MKKALLSFLTIFVLILGGLFFYWQKNQPDLINDAVPLPQIYKSVSPTVVPQISSNTSKAPSEINLSVPFTVQAPHANWEFPYGDFCEEASVLMAASYIKGWTISTPDVADKKMLEIKDFEEKRFGYHIDTTAEETAVILREFYSIEKVKTLYNPTIEDIKKALSEKKVIIVPAAGRQLGNPYFRQPGPLYHMLVIKGYTKEGNFITNDPGTKRGADFIYKPEVIMNAIHDWNDGDVENGRKVIIIIG